MRRDPQPPTTLSSNNPFSYQVFAQRFRVVPWMLATYYHRFFIICARTDNMVAALLKPITKQISQIEQMRFDFINLCVQDHFQRSAEPKNSCHVLTAGFKARCSRMPAKRLIQLV